MNKISGLSSALFCKKRSKNERGGCGQFSGLLWLWTNASTIAMIARCHSGETASNIANRCCFLQSGKMDDVKLSGHLPKKSTIFKNSSACIERGSLPASVFNKRVNWVGVIFKKSASFFIVPRGIGFNWSFTHDFILFSKSILF